MAKVLAVCSSFLLFLLVVKASDRYWPYNATELVSDGKNEESISSFLHLKGMDSSEGQCEHMYGFLPCSENLLGHLFLILVYEYLLFHGESYLLYGGGRIFEILGTGYFGASVFPVIAQLPEPLILLVSGLFSSDEGAQENVLTGVGLLAGSTIIHLTLLWGTCLYMSRQVFSSNSNFSPSACLNSAETKQKKSLSGWTGFGVVTDSETSYAAGIMLLSLLPFIVILIPKILGVPYAFEGYKIDILITLIVSVISLLGYFYFQISNSPIQKRRLEYLEVEHQTHLLAVINHVQEYIPERLLDDFGAPNESAIKRLFQKIDKNGDNHLSVTELTELFNKIRLSKSALNREKVMEKILKDLDHNGDEQISWDEFNRTFKKWLQEIMCAMDEPFKHSHHSKKQITHLDEAIHNVREEQEKIKHLKREIINQVRSSPIGNFCATDGTLDESTIRKLFEKLDVDNNNTISQSELKKLISDVNFGKMPMGEDEAVVKIMEDLDIDGDKEINEEEFTKGFKRWINSHAIDEYRVDKSAGAWAKAILLLVLGIAMLAVLAEPLIHTVQKFSTSANIPSFYASFVLVPLATSARTAISAIRAAKQKIPKTTSLTFSEIYDGVFMNNVLGFSVLLSIVYFRGLTWHFSAEVMTVFIVCAIMGLIAALRSKFPVWIMFIAYLLYPLSLILVYVVDDYFWLP